MQTIKTNGREIVAVEVPERARDFELQGHGDYKYLLYYDSEGYACSEGVGIGFKLIGLLSELTAEQCEPYAPKHDMLNSVNDKEKFVHLLGMIYCLDTQKPLLIIEKLK